MADGVVLQVYEFYAKTFVIEIDHGTFIARYGEVSPKGILVDARDKVTRGRPLAKVGQLAGLDMSMLHLEMYGSTDSPLAKGKGLTQKGIPPFQRRDDLINPTQSIDQAVME
jgi:murein DD-endopeptidase MepM/ murein hydrolase activator NlpD